ncbi:MAG TPA: transporter substrate-binding domain-containing protein [Chthoniobacterales bacterium]
MKKFALLAATLLLASCGLKPSNDLRIGMDLSYPPFEMRDAEGRPAGISVEMAKALGEYLGRPVRIENIPFTGLIAALKGYRIDLILSSLTATEERRQSIDFSDPYLRVGLALLVNRHSGIRSLADADQPDKTVAVRQGTTAQLWAAQHLKRAKILTLEKENAAVLEVIQGKADAFIYDQISVWNYWRQNPETTEALLEPLQSESWAIGLRQKDEALKVQVNQFLKAFREQKGFDRLGDQFLGDQKKEFQARGIPFYF